MRNATDEERKLVETVIRKANLSEVLLLIAKNRNECLKVWRVKGSETFMVTRVKLHEFSQTENMIVDTVEFGQRHEFDSVDRLSEHLLEWVCQE